MKKSINGKIVEITPEEIAKRQAQAEQREHDYWINTPYKQCVSNKVHERYSYDDEIAIIRQKDEKPEEHKAYYEYCEACKAYVKQKKEEYANVSAAV